MLGFARLDLKTDEYPLDYKFNITKQDNFNFPLKGYTFIGLISLIDPPKITVPSAVKKCLTAGIKVIMVTGD